MRARTLRVRWSKRELDWMIHFPRSADGHLMYGLVAGYEKFKPLVEELEKRGYDTTKLTISVPLRDGEPK